MNIQGLKEHIHYNFPNLRFVERYSINELVLFKKDINKPILIAEDTIKNSYIVTMPGNKIKCNNISCLFTLLEYIN